MPFCYETMMAMSACSLAPVLEYYSKMSPGRAAEVDGGVLGDDTSAEQKLQIDVGHSLYLHYNAIIM